MIEKSARFATYSRPLCWIVAAISLLVAIITFSGGAENGTVRGLLWLALGIVFATSAIFLGRNQPAPPPENPAALQSTATPAGDPGADVDDNDREEERRE